MTNELYDTLQVIRSSKKYNHWLYSQIAPYLQGRVLDIGSGLGNITRLFSHHSILEVVMSDLPHPMFEQLQKTSFDLASYRFIPLDISQAGLGKSMEGSWADTITCVNVLEHIEDDLTAIKNMHYLLKKNGRLVIFVPALKPIYGSLDKQVGHFRRYRRQDLITVLTRSGFHVVESRYMNFLGIFSWFIAGRVLRQNKFHPKACSMLDKCVPLLRLMEQWGRPPIGQSLIIVAEKL